MSGTSRRVSSRLVLVVYASLAVCILFASVMAANAAATPSCLWFGTRLKFSHQACGYDTSCPAGGAGQAACEAAQKRTSFMVDVCNIDNSGEPSGNTCVDVILPNGNQAVQDCADYWDCKYEVKSDIPQCYDSLPPYRTQITVSAPSPCVED